MNASEATEAGLNDPNYAIHSSTVSLNELAALPEKIDESTTAVLLALVLDRSSPRTVASLAALPETIGESMTAAVLVVLVPDRSSLRTVALLAAVARIASAVAGSTGFAASGEKAMPIRLALHSCLASSLAVGSNLGLGTPAVEPDSGWSTPYRPYHEECRVQLAFP